MKNKKYKKQGVVLTLMLMSVISLVFIIQSCSTNEDQISSMEESVKGDYAIKGTKETDILKSSIKNHMIDLKSITYKNEEQLVKLKATDIQIDAKLSDIMDELSSKSLNMLTSYGFRYADIEQYVDNENDPRIALMGIVFLHLIDQDISPHKNIIRLKNTSEEQEFSYGQVMDCLGRVFLGVNLAEYIAGNATKFTLSTALGIAGRVAARSLGTVLAAVAIVDFGDCMGWYNLW